MGDNQVSITYEMLYDMLRNEKAKFELQNIPVDIFSSTERSKQEMQLHNAKKLLRELYERREKKIMDMALNKSKTNSAIVDREALLPEERGFFEALVILFNRYRDGVLNNIFQLKHPLIAMAEHNFDHDDFEVQHPAEIEKKFEKKEDLLDETQQKNEEIEKRKTIFDELKEEKTENSIPKITFLKSVERFVDEDLNYYGPFAPGDIAEIPSTVAAILIEQGKAKQ